MTGPRVSIVNYTLSMMRGGGETRDLAFATHLRDLGCDVTLVSVDPLFGQVRHPIEGVPSRLLKAPYFRDLVYRLMVLPKTGRLATFLLNQDFKRFSRRVVDLVADPELPDRRPPGGRPLPGRRGEAPPRRPGGDPQPGRPAREVAAPVRAARRRHHRRRLGRAQLRAGARPRADRGHRRRRRRAVPAGPARPRAERPARRPRGSCSTSGGSCRSRTCRCWSRRSRVVRRSTEDAALVLVGEGALEGQIREQVARLGLADDVTFLGHQPQSRLPALYAASEVVLLSSSFDNSPNCVLEANACERPVVATRVGGVPRYVTEGENGLLADERRRRGLRASDPGPAGPARARPRRWGEPADTASWSATPGARAPRSWSPSTTGCSPRPRRRGRHRRCAWRSSTTGRSTAIPTAASGRPRARSAGTSSRWPASSTRST